MTTLLKRNKLSTVNGDLESRQMLATVTVNPGEDINDAIRSVPLDEDLTLSLATGVHKITAPILLRSNLKIDGAGRANTIIEWDESIKNDIDVPMITNKKIHESDGAFITFIDGHAPVSDVIVRDLKLRGAMDDNSDPNANKRLNMHGVLIEGEGDAFKGVPFENGNVLLNNVEARNFGAHGVHIKGTEFVGIVNSYLHTNGFSDTDLFHNAYIRRADKLEVAGTRFESSPAGHGLRIAEVKDAFVGTSEIKHNADHGLHVSDNTALILGNEMHISDGDQYSISDNSQNPHDASKDFGVYSGAKWRFGTRPDWN